MSAEAFRPFAVDSPRLAKTVRGDLESIRAEMLASAFQAQSWDDFLKQRGIFEGIEIAIAACRRHEEQN
jgi:hypothetical protein